MSVHPVQCIAATLEHVVTASSSRLCAFDAATTALIATSEAHKGLVRLVAPFTDPATGKSVVVSTGEDKLLVVHSLPDLAVLSSREIPKRANALELTAEGDIVVGDKFGDVYIFPLEAPVISAGTKPADVPKPQPILGHVSMLNTLALVPADPAHGLERDWIATGDRDEHVRLSRYPQGHVIEKYAFGSKHLVSSLLYLAGTPSTPPYLLSAGADPTLQLFALPSASLAAQFPLQDLLEPYLAVAPEMPTPVPAGKKKDKRGTRTTARKRKGGAAATAAAPDSEGADSTPAPEGDDAGEPAEQEDLSTYERRLLPKGLAVIKLVQVGATTDAQGGIMVLAAGSSALLFVPFTALLPSSTSTPAGKASLLAFAHPILDFAPAPIPQSASSAAEFLVALDTTRPATSVATPAPAPATPADDAPTPVVRAALDRESGQLVALATLTTDAVFLSSACASSASASEKQQGPSTASLYPVLSLLHHPGDDDFGDDADVGGIGPASAGNGLPKGGRGIKRPHEAAAAGVAGAGAGGPGEVGGFDSSRGKRASGRAETLRRYEEAKRKLAQEGGAQGANALTEGEKAAVKEMEDEARRDAGAEMEGAEVA
ncbi:Trm82p [Rhodotorula paludigena]|uniref:Trm82p n=1 Tax=Rhodotorula paludigena TaxID=86838 RepID=UPI0031744F60